MASAPAIETGVTGRASRGSKLPVDLALALAAFAGTTTMLLHRGGFTEARSRDLDVVGVLLAAVASLPLVWRRRAPLAVFVLTAAASAPLLRYQPVPPLGPTIALYLMAATSDARHPWTRRTTVAVALLFSIHVAAVGASTAKLPVIPLLFSTLGWAVAWVAGDRARLRQERLAELEERATRVEREAHRERRLATVEERMRIARDLHDSAGHALNVILMQAGAARLLRTRDPAGSQAAIETIEEVARQTVGDIDRLVTTLRDSPSDDGRVEAPTGLAAVDSLVAQHRVSGLDVTIDTVGLAANGRSGALPATVDQAAYRILQEALTNAAKHGAGAARGMVRLADGQVEISVVNPAAARTTSPIDAGHGLVGMRERAALLGGLFDVTCGGGMFEIRASLPVDPGQR